MIDDAKGPTIADGLITAAASKIERKAHYCQLGQPPNQPGIRLSSL